jgi:transposase
VGVHLARVSFGGGSFRRRLGALWCCRFACRAARFYRVRAFGVAVSSIGGTAYVPFKSNTTPPTEDGSAWSQMYHYFMQNREKFLEHYHQRSNVETAFSQIKGKFGDSLRSKSDVGQVNEALCKILCHNLCVLVGAMQELGIEPAF